VAATVLATTVASRAIFRVIALHQGRAAVAVDAAAVAVVTATTAANQVICREIAPSRERSAAAAAAAAVECSASSVVDMATARPTAEIDPEDDCPKPFLATSAQRFLFFFEVS